MPVDKSKSIVSDSGQERVLIPEGMYTAQIVDVKFKDSSEDTHTKFTPKDKFVFELAILDDKKFEDGTTRGSKVWFNTSTAFTAGWESESGNGSPSKLYELACSVYGERIDPEDEFDVNVLIGGQLQVLIKHRSGWANIAETLKVTDKLPEIELVEESKPTEEVDIDGLDFSDL